MSPREPSRRYRSLPIPRRPAGLAWPSGETAIGEQIAVTIREAAELVGVTPGAIRSRIERRTLPAFRWGRRIVVRIADLSAPVRRATGAGRRQRTSKFKTRNVRMAAWLRSLGYRLLRIQGTKQRTFIFEPVRTRDVNAFHAGSRKVAAERLFDHLEDLANGRELNGARRLSASQAGTFAPAA